MKYLQDRFRGTAPPSDHKWQVGEAVVAQYSDDNKYYRARITEKTPIGYKVRD